ncbi:MAG: thioredoxin family protein [Planctomycetaceae bacterium]|nr:thioredoxin family protein [Planctomycetaceae bacterium]
MLPSVGWGQGFGGGFGQQPSPDQLVRLSAKLRPEQNSQRAMVELTAVIAPQHHVYSTDQAKPGRPSVISLSGTPNCRLLGTFVADKNPLVKERDPDLQIRTETFKDKVTWSAAVEFPADVVVAEQVLELKYSGLVCKSAGSCFPIDGKTVKTTLGETVSTIDAGLIDASPPIPTGGTEVANHASDSAASTATSNPDADKATSGVVAPQQEAARLDGQTEFSDGFATITGKLSHRSAKPGDTVSIFLTADVIPGHHTYPNLPVGETPAEPYMPTYLGVLSVAGGMGQGAGTEPAMSGFQFSNPVADQEPHDHVSPDGSVTVPALDGIVNWEIQFQVPKETRFGTYQITGVIQYQTCDEHSCQPPLPLVWQVPLVINDTTIVESTPAVFKVINAMAQTLLSDSTAASKFMASLGGNETPVASVPSESGKAVLDVSKLKPDLKFDAKTLSVPMVILVALFGGFVLNFMPCVLPVIGLKILSLVEQAGESRVQAFKYNGVYVLGMLAVFWVLALMIAFQQMAGWGSQFSSTLFTIVFSGVIFAMALSYLEVWEIVLPSAVGQHSAKLEQKEGLIGTFFKGGVTTILATPCSGPGLATALAWCADKPPAYVFLVFTCLGLGMGLPYLAVAIYPPIISFLPKPGPWMLTFKQVMGFVLLGTVAFFLSYIELAYLFPTVCFLMVIWFGCWLVGRLSFLSSTTTWMATWAAAVITILAGSHFIYGWKIAPESSAWLSERGMPFDWNAKLANSWNLYDSQEYRLNTFVDRQIQYRQSQPVLDSKDHKIDWKPFSLEDLESRLHGEKPETILIDFTAEWCANCKVFERTVLHSEEVEKRLRSGHVTTVIADKTLPQPDMDAMLKQLTGTTAIPVYAIFAKDRPFDPIVLDGTTISIANVQAALDKAGVPAANEIDMPEEQSPADAAFADNGPPMPVSQQ